MNYYLKFVPILSLLLLLFSGCKSNEQTKNQSNQLRNSGESNKETVNISDLINDDETTIICVRHAEKELTGDNPSLTAEGMQRAKDLSMLLKNENVDEIYSSDYNRTVETAQPLADRTKLPIQIYNPRELEDLKNTILSNHLNEVVVVVGHSNSTPMFVNGLSSEQKYDSFDERDYDNIFVVSVDSEGKDKIHLLEFGEVSDLSENK